MIQTNLDLNTNFIMDIALGDKNNAKWFIDRLNFHLNFKNNKVFKFLIVCSDEKEWERRHNERIQNPLPNQIFKSFEHVKEHYKNADTTPFEDEYVIDTADPVEKSFEKLIKLINKE